MPKKAKEMSALEVKNLSKPGLHFVGGVAGLALQVAPSGSKSWILRATMGGKVRDMGLGGFPDVTLASARESARSARDKIRNGIDPIEEVRVNRSQLAALRAADVTFEKCALDYLALNEKGWSARSYDQWKSSLELHVFPKIGSTIVRHVDNVAVLGVLNEIWTTKTETATRVRGRMEKILTWAKVRGLRTGDNPAAWEGNLEASLPAPESLMEEQHFKALPYRDVGEFMQRLRPLTGQSARCLEFAILTTVRSAGARGALWSEIDFSEGVWTVPAKRNKGRELRVPLSKACITLLESQPHLDGSDFIFQSPRGGMLSDAIMNKVIQETLKADATTHGFRSSFKDWAVEQTDYPNEMSEIALSHQVGTKVELAYRRGDMFEKRRHMMEDWAEFCSRKWIAKPKADVLKMKQRKVA